MAGGNEQVTAVTFRAAVQATKTVARVVVHEKKENRFRSAFMQIKCGHCFFSA